jgi:dihydropteroate synthase
MAVVNVTPDSFYAASRHPDAVEAVDAAVRMAEEGADILDIGGESSRPGALPVPEEEEMRRVIPVVARLRPLTSALISIDTRKAAVAERALAEGADLVNDISALGFDSRMAEEIARTRAGVVLMHMQGSPETMQEQPRYDDVVIEVRAFLARAVAKAEDAGIEGESILVDPGIGFGKTVSHNLTLLDRLKDLTELGKPILVGPSRKSFIGRLVGDSPESRLLGTAASVACAVLGGASVVRVHDVREMRDVVAVADAIRNEGVRDEANKQEGPEGPGFRARGTGAPRALSEND